LKRALRALRWAGIALVVILVVAVSSALVVVRTDRFRVWLRDQLVTQLNAGWEGELAVGRLEGSIFGDLALRDIRLRHQDVDVLVVPRVGLGYALWPLLEMRVEVTRLDLEQPVADLRQDAEGRWNLLEAVAAKVIEPAPPPSEGSGLVIDLQKITLAGGTIAVTPAGQPLVRLGSVALEGEAELLPKGVTADLRRLDFEVAREGLPLVRAGLSLAYAAAEPPHTLDLRKLALETSASKAQAQARVSHLDVMATDRARVTVDGNVVLEKLAGADLVLFEPRWRAQEDVTGKLELRGPLSALEATLQLAAVGTSLAGRARADVVAEPQTYEVNAELAKLELERVLEGVRGAIEASLQVRGTGLGLAGVEGDARLQAAGLAYGDTRADSIALTATARSKGTDLAGLEADARVQGTGLAYGEYRADTVALTGGARGERLRFDLQATSGQGRAIARGDGLVAAEPTGQVDATVTSWPVGATKEQIERARLRAGVGDGRLRLTEFSVAAKGASANAKGDLGLRAGRSGRLEFAAKAADLAPWLELAGRKGTGSLALSGAARGSIEDLAVTGALDVAPFCDEAVSMRRARAAFDVAHLGGARPEGRASLAVEEFGGPARFDRIEARTSFTGSSPQRASVDLTLQESKEKTHRLRAEAELRANETRASVTELSLALEDGAWRLEKPAAIVARGGGVEIDRLSIAQGDRRIWVAGNVATQGPQSLALAIERFPIANLRPFLGENLPLDGAIVTKLEVGGTAAAPTIAARAEIADLMVQKQRYDGFAAALQAVPGATTLEATFRQDATHSLVVNGRLPVQLRWDGAFRSDFTGEVDLRARSPGLSLAFLNLAGEKLVRDAAGDLVVDVAVRGPFDAPVPSGTFAVRGAKLVAVPLGVDFHDIGVEASLTPQKIAIPTFQILSGRGGSLTGSVEVGLAGRAPDSIRASFVAKDFGAVYTNEAWAKVSGQIGIEGPLSYPHVKGDVVVDEAIIRPDLEFLGKAPKPRDDTIHIVPIGATTKPVEAACAEMAPASAAVAAAPGETGFTLDVGAKLPGNAWIKHSSATVELTGDVRALKGPGGAVNLVGVIETRRGWAELQGKRFNVKTGRIAFTGGDKIDPALELVGEHKVPEYRIEAVIAGTAEKPSLELRSDPYLEQADILSVLLFGKPTNRLSEGEQQALSERAAEMATGFAVTAVAQSVAKSLGLEEMGIHIEELSMSRVAVGKYISEKTFVTVAQTLDEEPGQEVAIEYRFLPSWAAVTSTTSTGNSAADVIWRKQY
jgi:autotransporter translocation and assembly factor TamB